MRKGGERCVAPPLQPPVLFIQTAMRSRRLINNFPEGRGPPSLYPPLPYFATWKFKSPGHQESANLVSSPVAPTFISSLSLFRGRRGSLIHLYRCESFSTGYFLYRARPSLYVYTEIEGILLLLLTVSIRV